MDVQTGLVYVAVVVISAAVIVLVSMFGIKEKSYEEAIAEQRKLPDDLLLSKKDKGKEKKHKNKAGKKVKEKKEEKEEKDDKEEKPEHVQFEENPQILPLEPLLREGSKGSKKKGKSEKVKPILVNKDEPLVIVTELSPSQPPLAEANHFDLIHPKDDLELIRSHSKENLQQLNQSEAIVNKSPKETPTKTKKNVKDSVKKKDENKEAKEEKKEEKKDAVVNANAQPSVNKDALKETKEHKETPVKDAKEVVKESAQITQAPNKESKKTKKKNDILAQIGGDKDAVNVSLLMPLVQKAELSRSEIQILIDQLLNKQLDNPSEHSEWTEGRADPVIKLKKQLAEKEKALADEHEANIAFQNKLKELRTELNSERSRLSASVRQLEEALNAKVTETQTLHTRMQHILESHAAEKQGFTRQIEQLQTKVNDNAAIIHKMQEDQGQTQGHLQQELITQRKQMEVQFAQMRENENALKTQIAQKHVEVQDLQSELQVTCESSTAEIDMLRQQLGLMQGQLMHSEGQLQHFKDVARQLEEAHCAQTELDHRLKSAHRHEQELQKQVNSLQSELNAAKTETNDGSALKAELSKAQAELVKLKSELSELSAEITTLKIALANKEEEMKESQDELSNLRGELKHYAEYVADLELRLEVEHTELNTVESEYNYTANSLSYCQTEMEKLEEDLKQKKAELENARAELALANDTANEMKMMKVELNRLQSSENKFSDTQLQITRLQEENDRLSMQLANVTDLQKQLKQLQEENESLSTKLTAATERTVTEDKENGIDDNVQKNAQLADHANLLAQKESQLNAAKTEANDGSALKAELSKAQAELVKLKSELSVSMSEAKSEAAEITTFKIALANKEEEMKESQDELSNLQGTLKYYAGYIADLQQQLEKDQSELNTVKSQYNLTAESLSCRQTEIQKLKEDLKQKQAELENARAELAPANDTANEMKMLKVELNRLQSSENKFSDTQLQITRLQEENDRLSMQLANVTDLQKQLKQLQEENESLSTKLTAATERPVTEDKENGIDDNVQKNAQLADHANLLAQKESQLNALKTELTNKEAELSQSNAQIDVLQSDVNHQRNRVARLNDNLEAQRTKNNELREKNWKVMNALSAAESRVKSKIQNFDVAGQKLKLEQEELTKAFLMRIFPEIKVSEKSHDQWLRVFEEKVHSVLGELKNKNVDDNTHSDLEKQNKSLQDMVTHYKEIIVATEGMLNKLQSHVESEESRWESQLRQKESEIADLRIELLEKVEEWEARLKDAESRKEQANVDLLALRSTPQSISSGGNTRDLVALEKLQEEKERLSEELQSECHKRATLDAEVTKLRSLVAQLQEEVIQLKTAGSGDCASSEQ